MTISVDSSSIATGPSKWLVLIIVSLNAFLVILDFSIVHVSFPVLTEAFQIQPSQVLWVTVVYALISAGLMPVFGKIADIWGHKKVFVLGYIIFTVGLFLCSSAQSISQLILYRSIQAIGGAMNMALSFAIVTNAFPIHERGKALGILASFSAVGPLVGFAIGGLLLDFLSWRAVFYTRIPLCLLGIVMAWKFLERDEAVSNPPRSDFLGAGSLFASLSCLLLFMNLGGREGFLAPQVLLLGGAGLLLFSFFIRQELRHEEPIVDLRLYKIGPLRDGSIGLAVVGLVQSGLLFVLIFLLQFGYEYSALDSGLLLALPSLLHVLVAPVSGVLSDKFGPRPQCVGGLLFLLLGTYLMARLSAASELVDIIIPLVFIGIGGGLFHAANSSQVMGCVPKNQLGSTGALMNTIRLIAISCSLPVVEVIFSARQAFHTIKLSGAALDPLALDRLALIRGFNDTMMMAAAACLFAIFATVFSQRGEAG